MFGLNLEYVQYYEEHRGCQTVNGNGVECAKVSPVVQSSGPVQWSSPPITDSRRPVKEWKVRQIDYKLRDNECACTKQINTPAVHVHVVIKIIMRGCSLGELTKCGSFFEYGRPQSKVQHRVIACCYRQHSGTASGAVDLPEFCRCTHNSLFVSGPSP